MKPLHELDALCAEKVVGWTHVHMSCAESGSSRMIRWGKHPDVYTPIAFRPVPSYTTDPAAVLGLLEKYDWIAGNHLLDGDYFCEINYPESRIIERAPTFALAATLALLKAHGVNTE